MECFKYCFVEERKVFRKTSLIFRTSLYSTTFIFLQQVLYFEHVLCSTNMSYISRTKSYISNKSYIRWTSLTFLRKKSYIFTKKVIYFEEQVIYFQHVLYFEQQVACFWLQVFLSASARHKCASSLVYLWPVKSACSTHPGIAKERRSILPRWQEWKRLVVFTLFSPW